MAEPITIDEALRRILASADALPAQTIELSDASGLALAEDIASDVDSPPFDKAVVAAS
jgi:molybdopterin biosynthesis enzyme